MILGKFKASLIPYVAGLMGYLSIIICYYLSQWYHQEQPFPKTWISRTADHYPEYIIFRIGTMSGAVLFILAYFINHFAIQTLSYQNTFNISRYYPKVTLITGILGALFLMGSTANLDTGKQDGKMHQFCAGNFFIWSIVATLYNTYIHWILYDRVKCVGKLSTYFKIVLCGLILLQVGISTVYNSHYIPNAMEYTLAFSLLGNLFILGWDSRGYTLVYQKIQQL